MIVKILKGDIKRISDTWVVDKDGLISQGKHAKVLPITEMISLNKKEEIKNTCYVDFVFNHEITFTGSMTDKAYTYLYELFIKRGNQVSGIPLPVEKIVAGTNLSLPAPLIKFVYIAIAAILLLALFGGGESSNNEEVVSNSKYTIHDKVKICKAYIGGIFGQPVSNIMPYQNSNGLSYVMYKKGDTKYRFVCDINDSSIVWAGYLSSSDDWGRWRTEDKVGLYYYEDTNSTAFSIADTGNRIVVKL